MKRIAYNWDGTSVVKEKKLDRITGVDYSLLQPLWKELTCRGDPRIVRIPTLQELTMAHIVKWTYEINEKDIRWIICQPLGIDLIQKIQEFKKRLMKTQIRNFLVGFLSWGNRNTFLLEGFRELRSYYAIT
jgi:hypothetical protein